jgi:DNA-binding NarL/FixJ family response regulator
MCESILIGALVDTAQRDLGITRGLRVVVVDDHPMAREWTRASLDEAEGITVIGVAETGAAGLHLVADNEPDVLVLDVHLPDMSGIEIARRVRAALPDIAIVVITGFDDRSYAQALLQLGVRGYLTKSASADEIVNAVREAAAGRTTVRSDAARPADVDSTQSLSTRDRHLLSLLASGRGNAEIATTLDTSLNVVAYRIGQLMQTLGARSRAEAIQQAIALGLARPNTFMGGMPSTPTLKVYHGSRSSSGKYTVQVQEGQDFHLLEHDCQTLGIAGCHSQSGWAHGFIAFGGIELARWLLADCLGQEYLTNSDMQFKFKNAFLVRLPASDWAISEADIRSWVGERDVDATGSHSAGSRSVIPRQQLLRLAEGESEPNIAA